MHIEKFVIIIVYRIIPPHDGIASYQVGHTVTGTPPDIRKAVISGKGYQHIFMNVFERGEGRGSII